VDGLVVLELLQVIQILPPAHQPCVGDETEPGRELHADPLLLGQQVRQLAARHVQHARDLVGIGGQLDVSAEDEDVVHLVLAPLAALARRAVVHPRDVLERRLGHLLWSDAQLNAESPPGGSNRAFTALDLAGNVERVAAARVGQHPRET